MSLNVVDQQTSHVFHGLVYALYVVKLTTNNKSAAHVQVCQSMMTQCHHFIGNISHVLEGQTGMCTVHGPRDNSLYANRDPVQLQTIILLFQTMYTQYHYQIMQMQEAFGCTNAEHFVRTVQGICRYW